MYMGEPSMTSYQPVRPEVDDGNESAAHSLTEAASLDEFLFTIAMLHNRKTAKDSNRTA